MMIPLGRTDKGGRAWVRKDLIESVIEQYDPTGEAEPLCVINVEGNRPYIFRGSPEEFWAIYDEQ